MCLIFKNLSHISFIKTFSYITTIDYRINIYIVFLSKNFIYSFPLAFIIASQYHRQVPWWKVAMSFHVLTIPSIPCLSHKTPLSTTEQLFLEPVLNWWFLLMNFFEIYFLFATPPKPDTLCLFVPLSVKSAWPALLLWYISIFSAMFFQYWYPS